MRIRLLVVPIAILMTATALAAVPAAQAPPNSPGKVEILGEVITLTYDGRVILSGSLLNREDIRSATTAVLEKDGRFDQVVTISAAEGKGPVGLVAVLEGSAESFPCDSDPRPNALPVVRHASGPSRSLLNNGVYDRRSDWLLSVDDPWRTRVTVTPEADEAGSRSYSIRAVGSEIIIRFRPRFYQKHRGISFFEPWTYSVWNKSVAGWCSWFAFFDGVTEADMERTAEVFSKVMVPFGFEYLQMDDGYQQRLGPPRTWLVPNSKFPSGLARLAASIRGHGLRPGIWTSTGFGELDFVRTQPDWFVKQENGEPAYGNWIKYVLDGSNPWAIDGQVRPVYRGLREMGWEYFKVDTLRHLRYEGYNSNPAYFAAKKVDPVEAYRNVVRAIREEVGRESFLLGCWGVRPELVGLIDACRLGTDGFSFAGLSQYNSFNNVVWRNDPDHIELSDREAYRSTAVTSLTGSLMMLTDKPERYLTDFAEPAKRSAPVLFTVPGQVYDVDPSRSQYISRVDSEVSGKEPKSFDAGLVPLCRLYALEIARPFEDWLVLGRTDGPASERLSFASLGLEPDTEYFVYDFWGRTLLGSFSAGFESGPIDPARNCQVLIIRERLDRPQVLATNRHITGGGVDLIDVKWESGRLTGRSRVVAGDPYEIVVFVPDRFGLKSFDCHGAKAETPAVKGNLCTFRVRSSASGEVDWSAEFISN